MHCFIRREDRKSATELGVLYVCVEDTDNISNNTINNIICLYNLTDKKSYELTFTDNGGYIHEHTPSVNKNISNCEIVPWTCPSEIFEDIKKLNIEVIGKMMLELAKLFN